MNNLHKKKPKQLNQEYVSDTFLDFDDSKKEISAFKKTLIYILFFPSIILLKGFSKKRKRENKALKERLRYFNPIIKQGFWSNSVSWVGREKPLSDEELENICKQNHH